MAPKKRPPSPTPSEGRSMRTFIRKPARFRSPEKPKDRRSLSTMGSHSTDSSTRTVVRRGPGRPRGTTAKRKRSPSTSPADLSQRVYLPAAFPSRSMDETPAQRKAFDNKTRIDMLTKFEEEGDGFGDGWTDVEPGPALERLHPDRHIVTVFEGRAKRACLAKQGFEGFFRKQIVEIYDGTVPESIGREVTRTALDTCWRSIAELTFGEKVEELEDFVAKVTDEVCKLYVPAVSPTDSHGPHNNCDTNEDTKEDNRGDTIAVRPRVAANVPRVSQATQSRQTLQRSQIATSRLLPLRDYRSTNPVEPGASIFKPSVPTGPEPYSEEEQPAESVPQQYQGWKQHGVAPLDQDIVNGTKYDNKGWDIDRPRGPSKGWQVHPEFKGTEEQLNFGSDDDE